MKDLYYLALNIYQFSYLKPLYRKIGGDFIVHKPRSLLQLEQNFFGFPSQSPSRGWFGLQPKTRYMDYQDYSKLSGVMVSSIQFDYERVPEELTTINTGHGTGYKPPRDRDRADFDYYFLDGPMRYDKLMNIVGLELSEDQMIKIGNMRFDKVINREMDRTKILDDFGVKDKSRPNVVYAPTWKWGGGTLLEHSYKYIDDLTDDYNLFIRPHYYDWRKMKHIKKYLKKNGSKHVYLVEPWNIRTKDTMENLAIADLLISDNSSVAYQSLIFQTPILIVGMEEDKIVEKPGQYDVRGIVDHWDENEPIKPLVDENIRENKYEAELKEMLDNCFYFNDGKSTERAVEFLGKLGV